MTILVCDDDKEIVDAIEIYLIQEGYQVVKAYDGEQALDMLRTKKIDLMVIDVMMPKLDGIRATFQARKTSSIPIIILSAKTEDADKILGLNVGADDYVTKPFNPLELVARVKSQLRRYTTLSSTPSGDAVYEAGGLVINDELKKVTVDGEEVKLTPIEYNILLLLMKNKGKVFSISQIYEEIWNEEAIGADNTVAVHIRHIREKIEINPKEPRYLKVVWGVGYKIEAGGVAVYERILQRKKGRSHCHASDVPDYDALRNLWDRIQSAQTYRRAEDSQPVYGDRHGRKLCISCLSDRCCRAPVGGGCNHLPDLDR